MVGKLSAVINQAKNTFSRHLLPNLLDSSNFQALVSLVNDLQFMDIHKEPRLTITCEYAMRTRNPLEYLNLYEDEIVSIGIFILKHGEKIPLHDHPEMYGLLKVLSGELEIVSYNISDIKKSHSSQFYYTEPIEVTKDEPVKLSPADKCCVLTPTTRNIHQVYCVKGPAAFLDILAPPYSSNYQWNAPRSCHYFEEIEPRVGNRVKLRQIPNPPGF